MANTENLRPFKNGPDPRRGHGKKGRSGRPRSVIREACAMAFDKRIKYLKAVVDGETGPYLRHQDGQIMLDDKGRPQREGADVGERLKAMDLLAKYGLGTTSTATDVEGNDAPKPGRLTDEEIQAELERLAREPD